MESADFIRKEQDHALKIQNSPYTETPEEICGLSIKYASYTILIVHLPKFTPNSLYLLVLNSSNAPTKMQMKKIKSRER